MRQHAQPQVPHAGHRRLARAAGPRLRRPPLLPPGRPRHAHRGDGVGHVRHRVVGQGALLGHLGVVAPTRSAPRGRSPSATTSTSRSSSSRSTTCSSAGRSSRSTPASTTTSASASPPGARWRRACSPASTSTASPTAAGPRCPATSGCASGSPTPTPQRQGARRWPAWPTGSAAPCRSWPSPGARPTPTCRRVITGASRVEQVHENLAAIDVLPAAHPRGARRDRRHRRLTLVTGVGSTAKRLEKHLGTVGGWNSTRPSPSCASTGRACWSRCAATVGRSCRTSSTASTTRG